MHKLRRRADFPRLGLLIQDVYGCSCISKLKGGEDGRTPAVPAARKIAVHCINGRLLRRITLDAVLDAILTWLTGEGGHHFLLTTE